MAKINHIARLFAFKALGFLGLALISIEARSQSIPPSGIGVMRYQTRIYPGVSQQFNDKGMHLNFRDRFGASFSGPELLAGKGGERLQELAEELKRFDGNDTSANSLLNTLNLGRLEADVEASLQAHIFALALGLPKGFAVFAGLPVVSANVKASLAVRGENNALLIKERLGDLAFDELKEGLDEASKLSTRHIEEEIARAGYEPIGNWSHTGLSDLRLGVMHDLTSWVKMAKGLSANLTLQLRVPTGYIEDPHIFTDVSFGHPSYGLGLLPEVKYQSNEGLFFASQVGFTYNFKASQSLRIPENDELLVSKDRTEIVTISPGADIEAKGTVGLDKLSWTAFFTLRFERHNEDHYSGSKNRNYGQLGKNSVQELYTSTTSLQYSTVDAYLKNKAMFPFMAAVSWNHTLAGKNKIAANYLELTLTSFFPTPFSQL